MTFSIDEITQDGFLDGALVIAQPKEGYRAATDPVFLAASIPAKSGQSVLELGCGVGVALLCLARRVPELAITGVELQENYAELARDNLKDNGFTGTISQQDITALSSEFRQISFDHVLFNPPYFKKDTVTAPRNVSKSIAHVADNNLADWLRVAVARVKPKGTVTLIQKADMLPAILAALSELSVGDIKIKPLAARQNRAANRVIVSARKSSRAPAQILSPFIIHNGEVHEKDRNDYTQHADAILRQGAELPMT